MAADDEGSADLDLAARGVVAMVAAGADQPPGHTVDRAELSRRAILAAIAHEGKTVDEIVAITGRSKSFTRFALRSMGDTIRVVDYGPKAINGVAPKRYIARNATPAPATVAPSAPRITLPGWAAALCA